MSTTDKKVCKINDPRINGYEKRNRSGSMQVFYVGNSPEDWERYISDGGNSKSNVEMHDKPNTIRIHPPEKHYYSQLIEGEWWWVDGCEECNGRPRDGFTYLGECEKHNVCVTCKTHRSEIKETPWGGRSGWQCKPCAEIAHEREKKKALSAMPEEYDYWDFHNKDEITCPYCAYEFRDSSEYSDNHDEKHECPRCDNEFIVTAVCSLTFDCDRINQ